NNILVFVLVRIAHFHCAHAHSLILPAGHTSIHSQYALNKTKKLLSYRAWEDHLVAEMDSALNGWVDSIPLHLRWDPNRTHCRLTLTYRGDEGTVDRHLDLEGLAGYIVQSLPSLAICTNTARSCSHIAEMSRLRKNGSPVPVLISSVFVTGVILLLNVWSRKRTGLPRHMNSAITEVQKCMATMRVCETNTHEIPHIELITHDLLHELATIGQVPLPVAPHSASEAFHTNKPDLYHPSPSVFAPALHPSPAGNQFGSFPTYTADLGKLPVFHQRTPPPRESTSSCNDVMAMWVTAPTGCEIDDWGVYLNVMSELNQGFETPVPQS
ncbi:hypothetical protein B0H14DRAFT_2823363, partial [Mycena olivaceomarginata]